MIDWIEPYAKLVPLPVWIFIFLLPLALSAIPALTTTAKKKKTR